MKKIIVLVMMVFFLFVGTAGTARAWWFDDEHDDVGVTNNISNENTNINVNCNRNVNRNRNININEQGQKQDQLQGQLQAQDQGQGQEQSLSNEINVPDKVTGYRPFVTPGEHNYPGLIQEAPFTDSPKFWNIEEILMYGGAFFLNDIVRELHESGYDGLITFDKGAMIEVVTGEYPIKDATRVAFLSVEAKGGSSLDALWQACYRAAKLGANVLHVTKCSHKEKLKSSGWGIGFHWTRATIGDGDSQSNVGSGGTGYSRGWAENEVTPWVHGIALKK